MEQIKNCTESMEKESSLNNSRPMHPISVFSSMFVVLLFGMYITDISSSIFPCISEEEGEAKEAGGAEDIPPVKPSHGSTGTHMP
jgi:hypothetical protein